MSVSVARQSSSADRVNWQTQQTSQPICRTHGQAQQTILQKLGRQLGVSWSSPAGGIRLPGTSPPYFIANSYRIDDATHSPASGAAPADWD